MVAFERFHYDAIKSGPHFLHFRLTGRLHGMTLVRLPYREFYNENVSRTLSLLPDDDFFLTNTHADGTSTLLYHRQYEILTCGLNAWK